jgi:hypothetical protein
MSEPEDSSLVDQSGSRAAGIKTKGFAHISYTAAFESDLRRLNLTELYPTCGRSTAYPWPKS